MMPSLAGAAVPLADAIQQHLVQLSSQGASVYTLSQYQRYEGLFLTWLSQAGHLPTVADLNLLRVREFLIWYRQQDNPHRHYRNSRGGEVAVRLAADILRRLGQVLEDNEDLAANPLRKLKRPRTTKHARLPFTEDEIRALHAATMQTKTPERNEALLLLMLATGMRLGEARGLRTDCLDLVHGSVRVIGKDRRERVVPFRDGTKSDGGRTVSALRRYLEVRPTGCSPEADQFLFLQQSRRQFTRAGLYDIFRRAGTVAHVANVHPHRFRHTRATWHLTEFPGDEIGLRGILGHISHAVLADYVHLSQATIAARASRASIVDRWLDNEAIAQQVVVPADSLPEAESRAHDILAQLSDDPELRDALLARLGSHAG